MAPAARMGKVVPTSTTSGASRRSSASIGRSMTVEPAEPVTIVAVVRAASRATTRGPTADNRSGPCASTSTRSTIAPAANETTSPEAVSANHRVEDGSTTASPRSPSNGTPLPTDASVSGSSSRIVSASSSSEKSRPPPAIKRVRTDGRSICSETSSWAGSIRNRVPSASVRKATPSSSTTSRAPTDPSIATVASTPAGPRWLTESAVSLANQAPAALVPRTVDDCVLTATTAPIMHPAATTAAIDVRSDIDGDTGSPFIGALARAVAGSMDGEVGGVIVRPVETWLRMGAARGAARWGARCGTRCGARKVATHHPTVG